MAAGSSSKQSPGSDGVAKLSHRANGIAVIALGDADERLVTLTPARMESLAAHIEAVRSERPPGLIITGSGPGMFTAGADVNLIEQIDSPSVGTKIAREGQTLFSEITKLPCPSIAAISGVCVGGGYELALACTYRIATEEKSTQIGLPEIRLGIIPGFGGTQLLPRLIGVQAALKLILTGRTVRAKEALSKGLVDRLVKYEQLVSTCEQIILKQEAVGKRSVGFVDGLLGGTALGREILKRQTLKTIERQSKGFYPAPEAALRSVLLGLEEGLEAGRKLEAEELGRLIVSPESKALVRVFFNTEAAKGIGRSARDAIEHPHAVVLGAGTMGAGIAEVLARNECSVILKDKDHASLERGVDQIGKSLKRVKYLSDTDRSFILNRIETTVRESTNYGNANLAIEAVFEDLDLKKQLFTELAGLLPEDAILASNTSSLSITDIAAELPNPHRVAGLHFFNPVGKMPLVEIVRGEQTSDRTIAVLAALVSKIGKYPIVVADVPGFLVNRVLTPYLNEAGYLLEEGFSVEEIDRAATKFGLPAGPFRVLDEVGLDVAHHVSNIMEAGYRGRFKGPDFVGKLVKLGHLGKKSGQGFYNHHGERPKSVRDLAKTLGVPSSPEKPLTRDQITDRLVAHLVNEAVRCLDEGVAGAPGIEAAQQINLGSVMGLGFPPFRGGVLYYADQLGTKRVRDMVVELSERYGERFKPTEGLLARAESDSSFQDAL